MKITSGDGSITITKMLSYDNMGDPEIEIQLSTNAMVTEARITDLESKMLTLQIAADNELTLRQKYPALQDQFEKYQVMLGLVKENESKIN